MNDTGMQLRTRILIGLAEQRLRECDGWSLESIRRTQRTVALTFSGFNGLKAQITFPRSYLKQISPVLSEEP